MISTLVDWMFTASSSSRKTTPTLDSLLRACSTNSCATSAARATATTAQTRSQCCPIVQPVGTWREADLLLDGLRGSFPLRLRRNLCGGHVPARSVCVHARNHSVLNSAVDRQSCLLVSYIPLARAELKSELAARLPGARSASCISARLGTSRGPSLDTGTRPLPREAGGGRFTKLKP